MGSRCRTMTIDCDAVEIVTEGWAKSLLVEEWRDGGAIRRVRLKFYSLWSIAELANAIRLMHTQILADAAVIDRKLKGEKA